MLLPDAVLQASRAAGEVAQGWSVHALSPTVEAFYVRYSVPLPGEGATLAVDLMKLARIGWEKPSLSPQIRISSTSSSVTSSGRRS